MQYTLISPIKIPKPRKDGPFQGSFEISIQQPYFFKQQGIDIEKPINTFFKSTPLGTHQAEIKLTPLTIEIAETYVQFQSLIGHCITNGEDINTQLRDLLLSVKNLNYSHEDILKMDFMKLRDVFSDFIDIQSEIHSLQNFSSKPLRKELTKLMFAFITDRNIYTHGTLRIQRPEEIFVIDYIENKRDKSRVEVTLKSLESFIQISGFLKSRLNEISTFYNKPLKLQ